MNLTAEKQLKFDVRMQGRPGWISREELQSQIDALPDVSSKIARADDDAAPASAPEAAPEAAASPGFAAAPAPQSSPTGPSYGDSTPAEGSSIPGFGHSSDDGSSNL